MADQTASMDEALAAAEQDGWVVVFLERRLSRPEAQRWHASAIRYGAPDRRPGRVRGWGTTRDAAVRMLVEEQSRLAR
jgi:hypothetical protein